MGFFFNFSSRYGSWEVFQGIADHDIRPYRSRRSVKIYPLEFENQKKEGRGPTFGPVRGWSDSSLGFWLYKKTL
jgi:hypothetical protein